MGRELIRLLIDVIFMMVYHTSRLVVVVRETILILFAAIKTVVDLQGFIAGSGGIS